MINIIYRNDVFDIENPNKSGAIQRIMDLMLFMNDNNILFKENDLLNNTKDLNVFSAIPVYEYFKENHNGDIKNIAVMICSTNILEPFKLRNKMLVNPVSKNLFIFHNAFKSYLFFKQGFNSIFLPMFLYKHNLPKVSNKTCKKYKYGIFIDVGVCVIKYLEMVSQICGDELLILSRNVDILNNYENVTSDRNMFFDSVDRIILLADLYHSAHVGSRFVFECVYQGFSIETWSVGNKLIKDRTLRQFNTVIYKPIDGVGIFSRWETIIDKSLVMTETYKEYLFDILFNMDDKKYLKNIARYQYAEEFVK